MMTNGDRFVHWSKVLYDEMEELDRKLVGYKGEGGAEDKEAALAVLKVQYAIFQMRDISKEIEKLTPSLVAMSLVGYNESQVALMGLHPPQDA